MSGRSFECGPSAHCEESDCLQACFVRAFPPLHTMHRAAHCALHTAVCGTLHCSLCCGLCGPAPHTVSEADLPKAGAHSSTATGDGRHCVARPDCYFQITSLPRSGPAWNWANTSSPTGPLPQTVRRPLLLGRRHFTQQLASSPAWPPAHCPLPELNLGRNSDGKLIWPAH